MKIDKEFISRLIENGRTPRLAERKAKLASEYEEWLYGRGLSIQEAQYEDLMDYVGYLQERQYSVHQLNRIMQALSDYYVFKELDNIAFNLRIRGHIHKTVGTQFTAQQLDEIYNNFEPNLGSWGYYYHSDKVLLSLIIYQGLELNSFFVIRIKDVDLKRAVIRIRKHNGRNERYLPLLGHQIVPIQELIANRDEIMEEWLWKRRYLTEEQKVTSDLLFSPQCDRYSRMHYQHKLLSKEIKRQTLEKLGLEVRKLTHFRQSRMCVWIKEHGLRKAQYLAGLRSVSSIERYQKKNLEGLKKAVEKWHPR